MTVGVLPVPPTVTLPTTTTGTPTSHPLQPAERKAARRAAAIAPKMQASGVSAHATEPRLRHSRARKLSQSGG